MSIPNFYRLEHSMGSIPSYQKFLTEKLNFHDGCVTLNGKPGLGYDLDLDEVAANINPEWRAQGGTVPQSKPARRSRRS
jgi:L-alanine-DL-glutamate epimerase-like enolase superfamily enzyme